MQDLSDDVQRHEELHGIIWDLYKDVHGVRPRHISFETATVAELELCLQQLEAHAAYVFENERQDQDRAAALFEVRVADTIKLGAGDRATAIRWIHAAEGTDGDDEYLCYSLGLRYGYFNGG